MEHIFEWLSGWVKAHCNDDWEHENGVRIATVSNPGWYIEIDLNNTSLEKLQIDSGTIEVSENDWCCYKIKGGKFSAGGDLSKLIYLITEFKKLVEENS